MSKSEYPNRDALREANDIYLDTMRAFIIHHLKQVQGETIEDLIGGVLKDKQADEFYRILDETADVASAIDCNYFPLIIKRQWSYVFAQQFNTDLNVQSMLWLIRKGRNSCEHRGTTDLNLEFVRMNLSLIADVLGKIKRPDKQREVEIIRDELDDTAAQLTTVSKQLKVARLENAKYKRSLEEVEKHLKVVESKKKDYKDRLETTSKDLETVELERDDYSEQFKVKLKELEDTEAEWNASEKQLAATRAENVKLKQRLSETENRRKTIELESNQLIKTLRDQLRRVVAEKTELEEHLKNSPKHPETLKAEYEEHLQTTLKQLKITNAVKTELEERLEIVSTRLEDVEVENTGLEKHLKIISTQLADAKMELADCQAEREERNVKVVDPILPIEFPYTGSQLRNYRKKAGLTQIAVAVALGMKKGSSAAIGDWEAERVTVPPKHYTTLKKFYGLEVLPGNGADEDRDQTKVDAKVSSYSENIVKSPKYQRKWRRPGAVAALRDPAEIQEAEAKIAKILNRSEKARLERELREAKLAVALL